MLKNILVGNSNYKNDLFLEDRMFRKHVFSVIGSTEIKCENRTKPIENGDVIVLHRNSGGVGTSGVIAITTVVGEPSTPKQLPDGRWMSETPVEPWIVLGEPISHPEIEATTGGKLSVQIQHTVNPIKDVGFTNALVDLIFDHYAKQLRAKF